MTLDQRIKTLANALLERKWAIATAESCTGGMLAQALTSLSGSSAWFERGFVTYSNVAKQEMLGVTVSCIEQFGAVSEETAKQMSQGALAKSHANLAISITGIAGPTGGTVEKPIGTVCFSIILQNTLPQSTTQQFTGNRKQVREQATIFALTYIHELLPK